MKLSDGTILMHGSAPYDPVKAHEYYLRTRQLKGRRKASSVVSKPVSRPRKSTTPTYTISLKSGKKVVLTHQQLVEQQAYAAKRVSEIKSRLADLGTKLKSMMADAEKKPSASERVKAARKSRQYRQSHKQQLATKAKHRRQRSSTTKKDQVTELQGKIKEIKGRLKAAVEVQRALATATKNISPGKT